MKFKVYRNQNFRIVPVYDAFEQGVTTIGHTLVDTNEDVSVIWSTTWDGMSQENKQIYDTCKKENRPVIFLDYGNLLRNKTWLVGIDNTNALGIFNNNTDLDLNRPGKLGLNLKDPIENRRAEILIVCQPERSLTWQGQPSTHDWVISQAAKISKYTDKLIVVKVHPQASFPEKIKNGIVVLPKNLMYGHDDIITDYNYHCVIDHSGSAAIQALIQGTPVICDSTSLAGPLSNSIENIEQLSMPDRHQWLIEISHTEWTLGEISSGIPLKRLVDKLKH